METEQPAVVPDIENKMRLYVPLLFDLGANYLTSDQWLRINDKFAKNISQRRKQIETGNSLRVATSLYDVIYSVLTGNRSAAIMLNFINSIFLGLKNNLSEEQKVKIQKTIYGLLTSFDEQYRNYLAELAVLKGLLDNNYTLLAVEEDIISVKTTADFTVQKDNEKTLIEVVSIHFYEAKPDLIKLVSKRIKKKINEKTNGSSNYRAFKLIPVLWAFPTELLTFHKQYKSGRLRVAQNVHEPLAYSSFQEDEIGLVHKFCGISELFTGDSIEIVK